MMRILVFGAGAMGSLIGGLMAQQHNVTFIGRQPHMAAIREHGLEISGKTELKLERKQILAYEDVEPLKKGCGPPELVCVTVKSYDTGGIIPEVKKIVGPETVLFSLQNGLDNEEQLRAAFPNNIVIGGTICHGVTHEEPGRVYHAGFGETVIGSFEPENKEIAEQISKILMEIGIENKITDNIWGELWAKVAINASINPITAITGLKNGWLLRDPNLEKLLEETCAEVVSVAEHSGIQLPEVDDRGDILTRTKHVVERTTDNKSSMLQDIEKGKRTEIDSINGAVVRAGEKRNIDTPLNNILTTLVKARETRVIKNN
jgi:2-dehydropantoate 2-reductase